MVKEWDIGQEARELDKLSIRERMSVENKSIMKMGAFIVIYFVIMIVLYFIL